MTQPDGRTVHGDKGVGVGVPYRHEAEASQPHVDLARDARRQSAVIVAVRSDESDADPPPADMIDYGPNASLGVTPQLR
jgi:hypothetical protein